MSNSRYQTCECSAQAFVTSFPCSHQPCLRTMMKDLLYIFKEHRRGQITEISTKMAARLVELVSSTLLQQQIRSAGTDHQKKAWKTILQLDRERKDRQRQTNSQVKLRKRRAQTMAAKILKGRVAGSNRQGGRMRCGSSQEQRRLTAKRRPSWIQDCQKIWKKAVRTRKRLLQVNDFEQWLSKTRCQQ